MKLAATLGVFLAVAAAAADPPPERAAASKAAAAEGALDVAPAPRGDAAPRPAPARVPSGAAEPTKSSPGLPPAARSGAWRSGARPPGEVPANVMVRAATRKDSAAQKARQGSPCASADACRVLEIIWNAPGT